MANTIDKDRETLNILLIEDDEDDWLLTRSLLSEIEGAKRYDLEWVTTYDAAVKLISEKHYDACLVDFGIGQADRWDPTLPALYPVDRPGRPQR